MLNYSTSPLSWQFFFPQHFVPLHVSRMWAELPQALRLQDPQQLHWRQRREEAEALQCLTTWAVRVRPSSGAGRECSGRPGRGERAHATRRRWNVEKSTRLDTSSWLAFRLRPQLKPNAVEVAEGSQSACRSQALPQHLNVFKLIKFGLF